MSDVLTPREYGAYVHSVSSRYRRAIANVEKRVATFDQRYPCAALSYWREQRSGQFAELIEWQIRTFDRS